MEKFKNKIRKKILDIGFDSVGFAKPTESKPISKIFFLILFLNLFIYFYVNNYI